jgi:hypothetical protein
MKSLLMKIIVPGQPYMTKARPANEIDLTHKNLTDPKHADGRQSRWIARLLTLFLMKHLRRMEVWLWNFNTICAAVADEPETKS